MKKIILLSMMAIASISSASALDISYKGFGELYSGYAAAKDLEGESYSGVCYGLSTTHGVTLIDGLFVGAGLNICAVTCDDLSALLAVYAEGRYNFIPDRKVNPYVGMRLGGGYNGFTEGGSFYFSPAVGVAINFTDKFGIDAGLGYDLFTGRAERNYRYGYENVAANTNMITFRVGVHF